MNKKDEYDEIEFFKNFSKYLKSLEIEDGYYKFSVNILNLQNSKDNSCSYFRQQLIKITQKEAHKNKWELKDE